MRFICKAKNLFIHLKRAIGWIGMLIFTLFKFWLRNPQETPAILNFILQKSFASSNFFSRNILIEKHTQEYETTMLQTIQLYEKYGSVYNPRDSKSYKKLEKTLSDKNQILYFLIKKLKPKVVVETGVAAGKSTGFILQALHDNEFGKLYSIDLPFQWYIYGDHKLHLDSLPPDKTPGYLVSQRLKKKWHLVLGTTNQVLPKLLKKLGTIDIFFHDSEHTDETMMFEYNISWPTITRKGVLISDDISYTEAFNDFSKAKTGTKILFKDVGILFKS